MPCLRWRVLIAFLVVSVMLSIAPSTLRAEESAEPQQAAAERPKTAAVENFAKPMGPPDAYNRGTPRGSIYGFLSAARNHDYERAAHHMDLRRLSPEDQARAPELARKLKVVLDQELWVDLVNLSDVKEGKPDDDLPSWQDRLGVIETRDDGSVTLLLQRVPRRQDGVKIWKVAASTVVGVPALYAEFEPVWLEEHLPRYFFETDFLGVALWKWLSLATLLALASAVGLLIAVTTTRLFAFLYDHHLGSIDPRLVHLVRGPVALSATVVLFAIGRGSVRLSFELARPLGVAERLVFVVAGAWFIFRMIDLAALSARVRLEERGNVGAASVLVPTARLIKIMVFAVGGLAALGTLGVNVTAMVAGLGVGGIAVALAAQKTIENLFGGVSLLADRPVRVGDFFRYGDQVGQVGTVEEIGLRSTRIRSLDRTLVTIPNAEFSNLRLENFAARDRMRLTAIIGVRYETTSDQLRYLLVKMREVLVAHPRVLPDPLRVRFAGFGACSLDVEFLAYVDTSDWNEFLGIREDIYLLFMDVVKEAGTSFAFPSSTTYVGRDPGLDEDEVRRAEERVAAWRAKNELQFPNFDDPRRQEIENTLDWPPIGSPRLREVED
jgi:MscS family membrane protein